MESELVRISAYGYTADIACMGAELRSLTDAQGTQYIWQRDERWWGRSSPILFPYIGVLKDGAAIFPNGQKSEGTVHGFARDNAFSAQKYGENSASFVLQWSDASLRCYPYKFRLEIEYLLSIRGLKVHFTVSNEGGEYMFFGLGGHPGFRCPIHDEEEYSEYVLRFPKKETQYCPYFNDTGMYIAGSSRRVLENETILTLEHKRFEYDALLFSTLNSPFVDLVNACTGAGIRFSWDGFSHLGVWTPKGKNAPLISLEPWTSIPAGTDESQHFEGKRDIVALAPHGNFFASYTISPLKAKNKEAQ